MAARQPSPATAVRTQGRPDPSRLLGTASPAATASRTIALVAKRRRPNRAAAPLPLWRNSSRRPTVAITCWRTAGPAPASRRLQIGAAAGSLLRKYSGAEPEERPHSWFAQNHQDYPININENLTLAWHYSFNEINFPMQCISSVCARARGSKSVYVQLELRPTERPPKLARRPRAVGRKDVS